MKIEVLLYIGFMVIGVIYNFYKQSKNKPQKQAKDPHQEPVPVAEVRVKKQPKVKSKPAFNYENSAPEKIKLERTEFVGSAKPFDYNTALNEDTPAVEDSHPIFSQEIGSENEMGINAKNFDLRKAVIYSTILERKFV